METWYQTEKYSDRIYEVHVTRTTEHMLFLPSGNRRPKASEFYRHWQTKVEAQCYLLGRVRSKIDSLESSIDMERRRLAQLEEQFNG